MEKPKLKPKENMRKRKWGYPHFVDYFVFYEINLLIINNDESRFYHSRRK